jgi:hypothetical protein
LGLSDYFTIIKSPKDLGTIVSDLQRHKYAAALDVWKDVCLVWSNCKTYNCRPENEDIRKICKRCEKLVQREWSRRQLPMPQTAPPIASPKAPRVAVSTPMEVVKIVKEPLVEQPESLDDVASLKAAGDAIRAALEEPQIASMFGVSVPAKAWGHTYICM